MTDLTTLTPAEIDTFLAANYDEAWRFTNYLLSAEKYLDADRARYSRRGEDPHAFDATINGRNALETIAKYKERLAELRAEARPYDAEYRRRGWHRYFLVKNSNGHVHRGMDCSTCYPTTEYGWLVHLADCDETAMVDEYGTMACTICFPDAPTLPGWKAAEERDAAAEAEKAAKVCPGSGEWAGSFYGRDNCSYCGAWVPVTRGGKIRKHDRPKEKAKK